MTKRVRRTLLSLAAVGFALSASAMGASAGGPGECGYCVDEEEFLFCNTQEQRMECDFHCGIDTVAECWEENLNCYSGGPSFDVWIECGFPD